jgi:hypothetical protein
MRRHVLAICQREILVAARAIRLTSSRLLRMVDWDLNTVWGRPDGKADESGISWLSPFMSWTCFQYNKGWVINKVLIALCELLFNWAGLLWIFRTPRE